MRVSFDMKENSPSKPLYPLPRLPSWEGNRGVPRAGTGCVCLSGPKSSGQDWLRLASRALRPDKARRHTCGDVTKPKTSIYHVACVLG